MLFTGSAIKNQNFKQALKQFAHLDDINAIDSVMTANGFKLSKNESALSCRTYYRTKNIASKGIEKLYFTCCPGESINLDYNSSDVDYGINKKQGLSKLIKPKLIDFVTGGIGYKYFVDGHTVILTHKPTDKEVSFEKVRIADVRIFRGKALHDRQNLQSISLIARSSA